MKFLWLAVIAVLLGGPAFGQAPTPVAGFRPQTHGTPIAVTTGGVSGTLPAGVVVVATNVGLTNGAYCALGSTATTSDQYLSPGGWFSFTVGSATQLTCITSTGTTTVNMVGGSGLPAGSAGGGGATGTYSASLTLHTLDIKTVTTGGVAVNAISAGGRTKGGWLQNPVGATIALCINEIGTATGTTSSGDTTCIAPGQSYTVAPATGAVSVITSDSSHPFSGMGYQ